MRAAVLYEEVRKRLRRGESPRQVHSGLDAKYSREAVTAAIRDVLHDEASHADETLVAEVERRLRDGGLLTDVIEGLEREGNDRYQVEKAVLRADTDTGVITEASNEWNKYSLLQFGVFLVALVLAIFWHGLFFVNVVVMLVMLMATTMNMHRKARDYRTELYVGPMVGFFIAQGPWGYNPHFGNYFRWWTLRPHVVNSVSFVAVGIFGATLYGPNFLIVSFLLAWISWIAWFELPERMKHLRRDPTRRD